MPDVSSLCRVAIVSLDIAAMDESASPRNPIVEIAKRSSAVLILLVACFKNAMVTLLLLIPQPLSETLIAIDKHPVVSTRTSVAPASIALSMSSLITDAGRSITSPAAILFIVASSRMYISFFVSSFMLIILARSRFFLKFIECVQCIQWSHPVNIQIVQFIYDRMAAIIVFFCII